MTPPSRSTRRTCVRGSPSPFGTPRIIQLSRSTNAEPQVSDHGRITGTHRFEYRTTLPREVDAENITAELTEGVLPGPGAEDRAAKPRRTAITGG